MCFSKGQKKKSFERKRSIQTWSIVRPILLSNLGVSESMKAYVPEEEELGDFFPL